MFPLPLPPVFYAATVTSASVRRLAEGLDRFVPALEAGGGNRASYHGAIDALRDYPVEARWGIHVYAALEGGGFDGRLG